MLSVQLPEGPKPFSLMIVALALGASAAVATCWAASPEPRVLHFPPDKCLGRLRLYTGSVSEAENLTGEPEESRQWQYFHAARGDVSVPANTPLHLYVYREHLKDLAWLKQLKPDDIHTLLITGADPWSSPFNISVMPHVSRLTGLRRLSIAGINVKGEDLRYLPRSTRLRTLSIMMNGKLLDSGLTYLSNLTSLRTLELDGCTDAGLATLPPLPALESLTLDIDDIRGPGLDHLARQPRLKSLRLIGTRFSEDIMPHLGTLKSLTRLHFFCNGDWPVIDNGLVHVSGLAALEELRFTKVKGLTDAGMVHLKPLHSLKRLDFNWSQVTNAGLKHLGDARSLESLDLPGGITDDGVSFLAKNFRLKKLRGDFSAQGLRLLAGVPSLEHLNVFGKASDPITDAEMESVARLANLKQLSFYRCPITGEGLAALTGLKSLESLAVNRTRLPISSLTRLNSLSKLTSLSLGDVEQDGAAMDLSGLKQLESLRMDMAKGSQIRNEDLACLSELKGLSDLQFAFPDRMAVGDAGLRHLAGLTNLNTLVIGGQITDDGLGYLEDMKKLERLTVFGNFSDRGLHHLEGLTSLSILRIYPERPFSRPAMNRLEKSLPCLFVPVETQSPNSRPATASTRRANNGPRQAHKE